MKTCSKCGVEKPYEEFFKEPRNTRNGLHAECKDCTKAAKARWAEENAEYTRLYARNYYHTNAEIEKVKARQWKKQVKYRYKRDPIKISAQKAVYYAVRKGKLVPEPCEVCGNSEVEAHHADYSRKLDVNWLCKLHHGNTHRKDEGTGDWVRR